MIFEMLRWWYVTGWMQAVGRIRSWTSSVEQVFSLAILVQTLFAPWRRIITYGGRGLDAKMRAALDNLVSRCVGFVIRFFVIIAALVAMVGAIIASTIMAIIWPLLPLAIILFAVKAVTG